MIGCDEVFKMTESAYKVIKNAMEAEKKASDEVLFVRLSMGVG